MSTLNKYFGLMLAGAWMVSCQPTNVPVQYNTKIADIQTNPYGAWIEVEYVTGDSISDPELIAGELISIGLDSVFVLAADHLIAACSRSQARRMVLYTHRNQAGSHFAMMTLFLIPNIVGAMTAGADFSGYLLLLGLPSFITGMTMMAVEASGRGSRLEYPERKQWDDFRKFARFPQGIPSDLDRNMLTMKKNE